MWSSIVLPELLHPLDRHALFQFSHLFYRHYSDLLFFLKTKIFLQLHHIKRLDELFFHICTVIASRVAEEATGGVLSKRCLKNFTKFTGKHLCWSLFLNKVAGSCWLLLASGFSYKSNNLCCDEDVLNFIINNDVNILLEIRTEC